MADSAGEVNTKKNRKRGKSKTLKVISFDDEVVPKDVAQRILEKRAREDQSHNGNSDLLLIPKKKRQENDEVTQDVDRKNKGKKKSGVEVQSDIIGLEENKQNVDSQPSGKKKKKRQENDEVAQDTDRRNKKKRKKEPEVENLVAEENKRNGDNQPAEPNETTKIKKKKRKKEESNGNDEEKQPQENADKSKENNKLSIRQQKREKHQKLLADKKTKTEIALQQKALNYLSKWKHCRNEWKFEKLRQIWLQQNMLDPDKLPNEFWQILLEYFGNGKGKARDVVLKAALKVIEESTEEEESVRSERARDLIQSLEE